jgi:pyridoxamine 5'-phosphate oxidase
VDIGELDPDPLQQTRVWREAARAAGAPVPDAMALATVTSAGQPEARMVILRSIDQGLVFCTDATSEKAEQLAETGHAAAILYWHMPVPRQVRVTGSAAVASDEESDRYWVDRPRPAQLSAMASWQSRPLDRRADLELQVRELADRFPEGSALPRPERWHAFRIVPASVEFWEEAPDALHDRIRFRRGSEDGASERWVAERLQP